MYLTAIGARSAPRRVVPPDAATCNADSVSEAAPRAPAHSSAMVGVPADDVANTSSDGDRGHRRRGRRGASPTTGWRWRRRYRAPVGLGVGGRVEEREGAACSRPGEVPASREHGAERREQRQHECGTGQHDTIWRQPKW